MRLLESAVRLAKKSQAVVELLEPTVFVIANFCINLV